MRPDDLRRFVSKIRVTDSCWEWAAGKNLDGYAVFSLHPKSVGAHRLSYEVFVGPIPDGLTIDHLCRNRGCVNPRHLEAVTMRENTLRGETLPAFNRRKTHCKRGHPFDVDNTYFDSRGHRTCRTCMRVRALAYYHRKRLEAVA